MLLFVQGSLFPFTSLYMPVHMTCCLQLCFFIYIISYLRTPGRGPVGFLFFLWWLWWPSQITPHASSSCWSRACLSLSLEGHPPTTTAVAGTSLSSTPGSSVWRDLFSASRSTASCTKLQNFSLNHLTKTCAISPEDFHPQFEV
jgi:hypothetical protein